MNSEEVTELGKDILKFRQYDAIDLYEGKILDGRNRYYACKEFDITPRFRNLPEEYDAEEYVYSKNLKRRHLTHAQRAELALRLVQIERRKAKERQLSNLKQFKKNKVTVHPSEGLTVTSGQAIKIVAKRERVSQNSLYTAQKVKKINDPEINEKWNEAKEGNATIRSVEKAIRQKYPSNKSETKKKIQKDQLHQKTKSESTEKTKEEIYQFVGEINRSTLQNFVGEGKKLKDNNNMNSNPLAEEKEDKCRFCSKATVLAFGYEYNCEMCGHRGDLYISRVICDDDFVNGDRKLRNPELKCENFLI